MKLVGLRKQRPKENARKPKRKNQKSMTSLLTFHLPIPLLLGPPNMPCKRSPHTILSSFGTFPLKVARKQHATTDPRQMTPLVSPTPTISSPSTQWPQSEPHAMLALTTTSPSASFFKPRTRFSATSSGSPGRPSPLMRWQSSSGMLRITASTPMKTVI